MYLGGKGSGVTGSFQIHLVNFDLLFLFIYLFIWPHGFWDLPWPGIKPVPPAVEVWSLNHWTVREVHQSLVSSSYFLYFLFLYINLFIYLFSFGYVGSSLLLWWAGATLRCGAQASHCGGFSCCRARALGAQAQQLWYVGSVVAAHSLSCSAACGIFPD